MIGEAGMWVRDVVATLQGLTPDAGALWGNLKGFGNSAFVTSLAGAFAGAYGAQKIALRSKIRDEVVKEIKETNSAIMLALTITNLGIALKRQHIQRMVKAYQAELKRADEHQERARNGKSDPETPFILSTDLTTLQIISPPIKYLEEIVLGKLSTAGRFVAAAMALSDAVTNLNEALQKRNDLIENYKMNRIPKGTNIQQLYLGWTYDGDSHNKDYGSTMSAIDLYLGDVIFFGKILYEELQQHGQKISTKNKKHLRGAPSTVMTVDFSEANDLGLIPDAEQYKDWTSGFVEKAAPVKRWWKS
jgi:hypothetical protein